MRLVFDRSGLEFSMYNIYDVGGNDVLTLSCNMISNIVYVHLYCGEYFGLARKLADSAGLDGLIDLSNREIYTLTPIYIILNSRHSDPNDELFGYRKVNCGLIEPKMIYGFHPDKDPLTSKKIYVFGEIGVEEELKKQADERMDELIRSICNS